jgi:hypothetical protein
LESAGTTAAPTTSTAKPTQLSQMKTDGPAISLPTSAFLRLQNVHLMPAD